MNTKLDKITTQYRKFNEDQALTDGQLNEFIDYFEDQDRLSRTRLSGVGIVCGFKSTSPKSATLKTTITSAEKASIAIEDTDFPGITITQGVGVTTDGDLITLRENIFMKKEVSIDFPSKNYTYYREYTDIYDYPHFRKNGVQIQLLELFTTEEYNALSSQTGTISNFKRVDTLSNFGSSTIILYLESYTDKEKPCNNAIDCDNQGIPEISNLKVLLADTKQLIDYLKNGDAQDSIYTLQNSYEELYDDLPNIEAKRVILTKEIKTAPLLKEKFHDAIQANDTISKLGIGFSAIADRFNINLHLNNGDTLASKLATILLNTTPNPDDYQYRYDLLKDLIDTYNEIKGLLLHLKADCCPSITSFPKHLMLGPVGAPLNLGDYTLNRHDFYNSYSTTNDDENYEKLLFLAKRFTAKMDNFRPFNGPPKITPSKMNVPLGEQAIPFYYDVNKDLVEKWNFEKTQTNKEKFNLSYHTTNLSSVDFIQNPLHYNIDDNDFYRVEGVLGYPYQTALQNIKDLITQYNLGIDVIALVLQKGNPTATTTASRLASPLNSTQEPTTVSVQELRDQLVAISSGISNQKMNSQDTLQSISKLDAQLKLLNAVEYSSSASSGVTVLKQNPKKDDVVSELLSDFLDRKSGLEHFAGVERGGTLVLVYVSEEHNQVIADFALPYLCCSKKDPVFLVLPATELCQNDTEIPITIVPLDGEVKAFVNGNTQIPVIQKNGGQNFFYPNLVNQIYLGEDITFTVNDDPVDTKIKVYEVPSINVTTGEVVYGENPNAPEATVTFNISGHQAGYTYTWDFDDNSTENPTPVNGIVTHKYSLGAVGQEDVYRPALTVTNQNGCSTVFNIQPITLKLVINKNTRIFIYFDSSGSMNTTLSPLQTMRDTLLKNKLLPLYGNDSAAYDAKVKVISNPSERTFDFLNIQGQAAPEGNIIVLAFQDEAQPGYHGNNITPITSSFIADIQALKARIANNFGTNNPNYYRGVVFQVDGNNTFKQLMTAVEIGTDTTYPSQYNLHSEKLAGKVKFKYDIPDGGLPEVYLNKIIEALTELGYNIP